MTYEPEKRPGVANLINIHSSIMEKTPEDIVNENSTLDVGQYKLILAETIIEHLKPIKRKIDEYLNAPEYLKALLDDGSMKAQEIADNTLKEVNSKIGFTLTNFKNKNATVESVV